MQRLALVVDDSRVARMTLSKLLVSHNYEIVELASGEDALAYLQSDNAKPDIIFMDVMMGGMDGLTATQKIKQDSELKAFPVVICTGNDTEADKDKALATGAVAVLSKPPAAEALSQVLSQLSVIASQPETPSPEATEIDDNALIEKVITTIKQDLIPAINQNVRDMAEDISRQIAADTAEQLVTKQVNARLDNMLPTIKEQLMEAIKPATEDLAEQTSKRAARDVVAKTAEQAVQRAIAETDFSAQVMQTLSLEGTAWLNNQQQQLRTQLSSQLEQTIAKFIDQQLEAVLAPLVIEQANKHLAQQSASDSSDQQFEQLSKRLSRLGGVVVSLGIAIVVLAAMMVL
ncbi:MAG: response regulator [Gammaproteobacteria bacterium]|nr:response regulator [Gammaproteobacteria bacterium]